MVEMAICCAAFAKDYSGTGNAQPSDVMGAFGIPVSQVMSTTNGRFSKSKSRYCYSYGPSAGDVPLSLKCPAVAANGTVATTTSSVSSTPTVVPVSSQDWFLIDIQHLLPTSGLSTSAIGVSNLAVTQPTAALSTSKLSSLVRRAMPMPMQPNSNRTNVQIPTYTSSPTCPLLGDYSDLNRIRLMPPLTPEYMAMMHLDPMQTRNTEIAAWTAIEDYNQIDGYTSEAALVNWETHNKLGFFVPGTE